MNEENLVTELEELHRRLTVYINELIEHDFQKLISILYRLDVNEEKLKALLAKNEGDDSGNIIAHLVIERQLQKIKSRQQFSKRDNNINDEDAW